MLSSCKYDHGIFKPGGFGFRYVLFTVNSLSKQNRVMRHIMRNLHELKLGRYAAHMIDINEYLAYFFISKSNDKIGEI